MAQKLILTEQQHQLIVNEIINEMFKNVNENTLLNEDTVNEGVWEKIKYGLSKLGRYKVGGKILGRGKIDQEAAAKIQAIIDKKGNEVIKNLDAEIKKTNPEFPNNEKEVDFLNTIMAVSAVYDSVVAATSKKPEDEGYLPIDAANGIINDLREYVKKFLDIDLKAIYSVVDEAEGNTVEISEEELKALDEAWGLNEDYFDAVTDENIEEAAGASDVRKALQAKRGDGEDFQSTRMQTLKSNKLPLLLAGIGSSMGAFSWLVNTEWFKHLFDKPYNYTDTQTTTELIQTKSEVFNDIKPGEGVYKLLGRVTDHKLDGNSSPQEFIESLKQIGGGDAHKGVDLLCQKGGVMMKPDEAAKGLHDLVNNPNQYDSMNDMFKGAASGTGKLGPVNTTLYGTIDGRKLTSILVKMVPQLVTKVAIKTGIKTGAGYAVAKGFGAVLGPIGVGLLAGGALVKLMRVKGQKQSRAKTLNDLYQSIRNIEGGVGVVEPEGETVDKGTAQDPSQIDSKNKEGGDKGAGGKGGSAFNDDLYNSLKNLFKFMVNNRKMLGVRGADNVGTGGATLGGNKDGSKGGGTASGGFKKGDKVTYKGKNYTVTIPDVSPGSTQIDADGTGAGKNPFAVKTSALQQLQESMLEEGKYIKDKRLVQFLQKSLSFDKLKSFEDFINRIEIIRNKIKKINAGDDKAVQNFLKALDSNPIMATNFEQLFAVDSQNPQAVNALKAFIDDLFVTVYSGKFKYGNMIDKMAELGGGINKIDEADKAYSAKSPNKAFTKDAQDRGRFKKNLINFLSTCISLFQYLHKKRTENNKNQFKGGEKPKGKKPEPKKPEGEESEIEQPKPVDKIDESPKLNEELNRIKNIMRQII